MKEKVVQASEDKQKWDTSLLRVCGYETQNPDESRLCACKCSTVEITHQ